MATTTSTRRRTTRRQPKPSHPIRLLADYYGPYVRVAAVAFVLGLVFGLIVVGG